MAFDINIPQTIPFSLTEMIRSALDNNQFACGAFINLQKAFDTVDHKVLLSKTNQYGIKDIPYEWFKSYLTYRQKFTTVKNKLSELSSIEFQDIRASAVFILF